MSHYLKKKNAWTALERWFSALAEGRFPVPTSSGAQLPRTPIPGHLTPSPGPPRHLHACGVYKLTQARTHTLINKSFLKIRR